MSSTAVWNFLVTELWRYSAEDPSPYQPWYRLLNQVEAAFWFGFTLAVLWRYARNRKSILEPFYALMFFLFGLTDVAETYAVTPLLILIKGAILFFILLLRYMLVKRHYPGRQW